MEVGYRSVDVVEEPGAFSRRGGIIDLFPPSERWPVRIELFGDEIDSMRQFDPSTTALYSTGRTTGGGSCQRSLAQIWPRRRRASGGTEFQRLPSHCPERLSDRSRHARDGANDQGHGVLHSLPLLTAWQVPRFSAGKWPARRGRSQRTARRRPGPDDPGQ